MSMVSTLATLDKECFLCTVKEIDGNLLEDSQESSLSVILCQILNVSNLKNNSKKYENINYCYSCKERILKLQVSLEMVKKLEKEVLEEKYLIELQLEQNNQRNIGKELHDSTRHFDVELVNECETFDELIPNGMTTPLIHNLISTENQSFSNSLSLPDNGNFLDSATDSSSNHALLPLTLHVQDIYNFKFETLDKESNSPTDITDPFEGIVPESDCLSENSTIKKTLICGTCEKTFDDYNRLCAHYCDHNRSKSFKVSPRKCEKLYECKYCNKTFNNRFNMRRHEYIHTSKPFKPGHCDKTFWDFENMKRHENIHKERNTFKCGYCDKTFLYNSGMKIHERIHTGDKPYLCKYCNRIFNVRSNLRRHEYIHTSKPFKCGHCDKKFYNSENMKRHENIHKERKTFKCGHCDKTFCNSKNMKRHENIHKERKTFKCGHCDKTFRYNSGMKIHERIHTGEKPYLCKYCHRTFRVFYNMKRHECIHTGKKPFKYAYCSKTFRDTEKLKINVKIHNMVTESIIHPST